MNEARHSYVSDVIANNELSKEDKAAIKVALVPQANKLITDTVNLVNNITTLLDQIKSQAQAGTGDIAGSVSGCVGGGSQGPENAALKLLSPVTNLLSLAQGLASNAQSFLSDVNLLVK
jgi:hypothetical protein